MCNCVFELGKGICANDITALTAVIAFVFSVCQYMKYKKRERVSILAQYNERYTTDPNIADVVKYLELKEDEKECTMPDLHKLEMYMRFCEELYFLIKASSMERNIAYYMFGHYIVFFDDNKKKWPEDLGYNKKYWCVFREFVKEMRFTKIDLYGENNKMSEEEIIKTLKI